MNFARASLSNAEKEFGTLDTNYASCMSNLSEAFFYTRDLDSAIFYMVGTGELLRKILNRDDPNQAGALNNLGYYYHKKGLIDSAESCYIRSVEMKKRLYKSGNADLVLSLTNLADLYEEFGKYDSAIDIYKQALIISRNIYNTDNPDLADAVSNLGNCIMKKGNYDEAEPLLIEALNLRRNIYKSDNMKIATSIDNLAYLYDVSWKNDSSEVLYKEALDMRMRLYPGGYPDIITSLNNLAMFYSDRAKDSAAEILLLQALGMARKIYPSDDPDLASSIHNLAGFYKDKGKKLEAESLFEEATAMYRRIYKQDQPDLALAIYNLSAIYDKLGKYYKSEKLKFDALAMNQRMYGDLHPYIATILRDLGIFYHRLGDYRKADIYYSQALDMQRKLYTRDHPSLAGTLNSYAVFLFDIGDFSSVEKMFAESLEMKRRLYKGDHPSLAESLSNLAVFYSDIGYDSLAEAFNIEAMQMRKRLYKTDHDDVAVSLSNLAIFYTKKGQFDLAEKYYVEVLAMYRRLYDGDNPEYASNLNNFGFFYDRKGDIQNAEKYFREALDMRKRIINPAHPDIITTVFNLAYLMAEAGRMDEAEAYFTEGIKSDIKNLNNILFSLSEKEREALLNTYNDHLRNFLKFCYDRRSQNPGIISDLYDCLLTFKGLLLSSSRKLNELIRDTNDSLMNEKFEKWNSVRNYLTQVYKMSDKDIKDKGIKVDSLESFANILEKELSKKSELIAREFLLHTYTWKDIQKELNPHEAAVEIVRFNWGNDKVIDSTIYVGILLKKNDKFPEMFLIDEGRFLDSNEYLLYQKTVLEKQHRTTLAAERKDANKSLYDHFWLPIKKNLEGIDKVYISNDGVFNNINLNTIRNYSTDKFVLDEIEIHYVTNTREIVEKRTKPKRENSSVLVGFPKYDLDQKTNELLAMNYSNERDANFFVKWDTLDRSILAPLPGTKSEIDKIASILITNGWKVEIDSAEKALEEAVKKVNNPRVLHIATHGFFFSIEDINRKLQTGGNQMLGTNIMKINENPLFRSGLFLAGAENSIQNNFGRDKKCDDGILTAFEAINLSLNNTELVVLSACETGKGLIKNGEGVYGLQRAFKVAGAETIIMSLWKVNDDATQKLMTEFYKNWVISGDKYSAFKKAQMLLKKEYENPYYWGAFVMVGE